MAKDYSEDLLIQKSTAELLEKELGWKSVYALQNNNVYQAYLLRKVVEKFEKDGKWGS